MGGGEVTVPPWEWRIGNSFASEPRKVSGSGRPYVVASEGSRTEAIFTRSRAGALVPCVRI
jgi:hypothetical protein